MMRLIDMVFLEVLVLTHVWITRRLKKLVRREKIRMAREFGERVQNPRFQQN